MIIFLQLILSCLEVHAEVLWLILGLKNLISDCDWELSLGLDEARLTMTLLLSIQGIGYKKRVH